MRTLFWFLVVCNIVIFLLEIVNVLLEWEISLLLIDLDHTIEGSPLVDDYIWSLVIQYENKETGEFVSKLIKIYK